MQHLVYLSNMTHVWPNHMIVYSFICSREMYVPQQNSGFAKKIQDIYMYV